MTDVNVIHNPDANRFEVQLDGGLAMVEYMRAGNNIIFNHTEVPEGHEGQGIASQMAEVALTYAKDNDLRVQPLCPFIKKYVNEHPEYQAISWGY